MTRRSESSSRFMRFGTGRRGGLPRLDLAGYRTEHDFVPGPSMLPDQIKLPREGPLVETVPACMTQLHGRACGKTRAQRTRRDGPLECLRCGVARTLSTEVRGGGNDEGAG